MADSNGGDADSGSRLQAAVTAAMMRLGTAWRTYIAHTRQCSVCIGGIDCELAADLKHVYREAKAAVPRPQ